MADLYQDPTEVGVITIDGQEYVLLNGDPQIEPRDVLPGQIEIDLLADAPAGTTLAELNADDIAATVANQIQVKPARSPCTGFDPRTIRTGRNDSVYEATPLPYSGGNLTITGAGQLGSLRSAPPPTNWTMSISSVWRSRRGDIDRRSIVDLDDTINGSDACRSILRRRPATIFYCHASARSPGCHPGSYTATFDGQIFIGISGEGN